MVALTDIRGDQPVSAVQGPIDRANPDHVIGKKKKGRIPCRTGVEGGCECVALTKTNPRVLSFILRGSQQHPFSVTGKFFHFGDPKTALYKGKQMEGDKAKVLTRYDFSPQRFRFKRAWFSDSLMVCCEKFKAGSGTMPDRDGMSLPWATRMVLPVIRIRKILFWN